MSASSSELLIEDEPQHESRAVRLFRVAFLSVLVHLLLLLILGACWLVVPLFKVGENDYPGLGGLFVLVVWIVTAAAPLVEIAVFVWLSYLRLESLTAWGIVIGAGTAILWLIALQLIYERLIGLLHM